MTEIKALVHDVFGTVVDWRSAVTADGEALGARLGITGVDWQQFADEWRGAYAPSMNRVRTGELPWTNLDALHRMGLNALLDKFEIAGRLSEDEKVWFNLTWHRLKPWPDSVPGLTRIKRKYIIATLSNGTVRLLTDMAKHCGLPWDTVLGSDLVRHYKPDAEMYQSAIEFLGSGDPAAVMMVAAHNGDLLSASKHGMKTAFIARPYEKGAKQDRDFKAEHDFTYVANGFEDLAAQLGVLMALEEYQRKRDFRQTPEPAGTALRRRKKAAGLSFVIQKHRATRLHYDFRLELGGVLLSWAVPKGPSLDPHEKRLAVHVEDHPLEYGGFEGVIPKGQYGGGTVMVWDHGTWTPLDADPQAALRKGSLKFRLEGEKLHGSWALVRMGGKAGTEKHENWLLIKERDAEARPDSGDAVVADNPLSVATGRSIEAIAAARDRVWDIERGEVPGDPPSTAAPPASARPTGARKRAMPEKLAPQLATAADAPPEGDDWLHEIKYDGYRLLAHIAQGKVRLTTRGGLDWTGKFPALVQALAALPVENALIDGELVALAADGTTSFGALQDAIARGDTGGLVFFAFDLLYRDGWDLTGAALEERKAILAGIVPHRPDATVRYSDHQQGRGPQFFRLACGHRLEGIIAKRRGRPYRPGRNTEWLKVKCVNRDEFIIIGYSEPAGARLGFGALLIGYYDPQGLLRYGGRVGTGFSDAQLAELRAKLAAIERPEAPVATPKGTAVKGVHWTQPRLVAQVRYGGWTTDQVLRHPSFEGLREDKSPQEVVYDRQAADDPRPADRPLAPVLSARSGRGRGTAASRSNTPLPAGGERKGAGQNTVVRRDGSIEFEGVRLTNSGRVFYPAEGVTKLQLAKYYADIAKWALPQLAGRALSMVRCPEGIEGQHFYQKHDMPGFSNVLGRVEIRDKSETGTYLFIKDLAGLIGVVQMGVLEIHPWGSTVQKLETPNRITFDFDPDEGLPWERVTAAALEMREALVGIGLQSFVKTTGGKGLHVVVPVAPRLGWDAVKEFSKWVSERFAAAYPDRFTTNMAKRARAGRIFIDYLRNARGATAIGAYSPRARAGAPVATPLFWEEVEQGARPDAFTVLTVPQRLAGLKTDPWAELATLRQAIGARVRKEVGI